MKPEVKQDFMRRISQANATGLVVILYDMFLTYTDDALASKPREAAFMSAVSHARQVLIELRRSLHMEHDIARRTYEIYRYVDRRLSMAQVRREAEPVKEVQGFMQRLRDAYAEAVKGDTSEPLMKNAETVYAGMTYGKTDINTESTGAGSNRGFFA